MIARTDLPALDPASVPALAAQVPNSRLKHLAYLVRVVPDTFHC